MRTIWGLIAVLLWVGSAGAQPPPPPPLPGAGAGALPEAPVEAATEPAGGLLPAPAPGVGVGLASGANVAIVRVEGMIYDFTLQSLERRVDRAIADGASLVVIELDTPGGVLTSAVRISRYLKALPVPTIAWVRDEAYSAGILIASATDQIVMSPTSATGDAAPVTLFGNLAPTERAKALSPLLEEFRDNATTNGYDYTLFHAMAVLGVEVYQIRQPETGRTELVNQADYAVMVLGQAMPTPTLPAPTPAPGSAAATQPAEPDLNVGAPTVQTATPEDVGRWELVQKVHDGNTLLTLNQTRARDVGLSAATIRSEAELRQHLGAANVWRVDQTWSEDLAAYAWFLTHPMAKAILTLALMAGLFIEMQSPGLGFGGFVALLALTGLIGAPLVIGLAEWWHIAVFILGLGLLALELIFVPGFGLLGIAGIVLMFTGLIFAGIPTASGSALPAPEMWDRVLTSAVAVVGAVAASVVGFVLLADRVGLRMPVLSRLVLTDRQPRLAGAGAAEAGPPEAHVSGDELIGGGRLRVGDAGVVLSALRPTGVAEFEGRTVDVVSGGGAWIDAGRAIRVVEVRGNLVIVEPA